MPQTNRREVEEKTRIILRTIISGKRAACRESVKANLKALQQNGALLRQMDRQANCKRQIEQGWAPVLPDSVDSSAQVERSNQARFAVLYFTCQRSRAPQRCTRVTP
jgi:hypothetical protein